MQAKVQLFKNKNFTRRMNVPLLNSIYISSVVVFIMT